jgi:hypothetical protein
MEIVEVLNKGKRNYDNGCEKQEVHPADLYVVQRKGLRS